MTAFATRTIKKRKFLTIFQRVAERDKTVGEDYIDAYGNFIWALARKHTTSTEEVEVGTREIFLDIWRYSERTDKTQSAEEQLIALIALRRLIKQPQ